MNKNFCILFIGFAFILTTLLFVRHDESYRVVDVVSPTYIVLNKKDVKLNDLDCFDTTFTLKNKNLAKKLNITEEEAFIMGNLGKYWAKNLLKGRLIYLKNDSEIIYLKFDYKEKFKYSGFCLYNDSPFYKEGFDRQLNNIRNTKYSVLDLDSDNSYDVSAPEVKNLKHFLVIKTIHLPRNIIKKHAGKINLKHNTTLSSGRIKILLTDLTVKLKPDRDCSTDMCQEILNNINNSQQSIDMAIYGYSRIPKIENALISAKNRGVKIRLVYDSDAYGNNIYPDTSIIKQIIPNNISDKNSVYAKNLMHNKFYIFDNKIVITGSANLSHTDMSRFNSKNQKKLQIYIKKNLRKCLAVNSIMINLPIQQKDLYYLIPI